MQNDQIDNEAQELGQANEKHSTIIVNNRPFRAKDGVKDVMSVNELAALVGESESTAKVRKFENGHWSEPLSGEQKVHYRDQFRVIRRHTNGGFEGRLGMELSILTEGALKVEYVPGQPGHIIYYDVPIGENHGVVDVIVPVPEGYPAAMIDWAGLPANSDLFDKVKGSVQREIVVLGRPWKIVSYHPHNGGGGPPWNPSVHGFHTYVGEILAWLGGVQ